MVATVPACPEVLFDRVADVEKPIAPVLLLYVIGDTPDSDDRLIPLDVSVPPEKDNPEPNVPAAHKPELL